MADAPHTVDDLCGRQVLLVRERRRHRWREPWLIPEHVALYVQVAAPRRIAFDGVDERPHRVDPRHRAVAVVPDHAEATAGSEHTVQLHERGLAIEPVDGLRDGDRVEQAARGRAALPRSRRGQALPAPSPRVGHASRRRARPRTPFAPLVASRRVSLPVPTATSATARPDATRVRRPATRPPSPDRTGGRVRTHPLPTRIPPPRHRARSTSSSRLPSIRQSATADGRKLTDVRRKSRRGAGYDGWEGVQPWRPHSSLPVPAQRPRAGLHRLRPASCTASSRSTGSPCR